MPPRWLGSEAIVTRVDHRNLTRTRVDGPVSTSETWELTIWATTDELWTLAGIEKTDWAPRSSRDHRTQLQY
jgi:hypothetical protein